MLSFKDFFHTCAGLWKTERTYHDLRTMEVERSYTEFQVNPIATDKKLQIVTEFAQAQGASPPKAQAETWPGFAIGFHTRSETGEEVSMELNALFIPDAGAAAAGLRAQTMALPLAAQLDASEEVIQGFYLRDEGYSEDGAIAGRFTYRPTRQILEMTTHYSRSVAVDQMRLISPKTRMRTIVTYQRPEDPSETPQVLTLVGFGVEHKS